MHVTPTIPVPTPGPPEWFAGDVEFSELAAPNAPSRVRVFRVAFAPEALTAWHTHPLGQVLHVLEGTARVQRHGGPVEEVVVGGTVWFAPGERHWHGAPPGVAMVHLAIQEALPDGSTTTWLEHVARGRAGE